MRVNEAMSEGFREWSEDKRGGMTFYVVFIAYICTVFTDVEVDGPGHVHVN